MYPDGLHDLMVLQRSTQGGQLTTSIFIFGLSASDTSLIFLFCDQHSKMFTSNSFEYHSRLIKAPNSHILEAEKLLKLLTICQNDQLIDTFFELQLN